ncbi:hypothetical protein FHR81_004280 [Actinoalloteichus hoggarensis]|uniref:Uncharacterized protein n=1 Tax=Actinoalloteichus hoggarensis TaxID=1470176 RepID=A0A221W8X4_9PSEU|nr:hypothetical protein [Actinoalloteichus hoggarensis]ASO22365.1 hypothetical protein AHOG_23795 [Actinoalloteichus hoggarensis]MBB5923213.1 hypothetical protein [Actinoalloteichus hoggarensis]
MQVDLAALGAVATSASNIADLVEELAPRTVERGAEAAGASPGWGFAEQTPVCTEVWQTNLVGLAAEIRDAGEKIEQSLRLYQANDEDAADDLGRVEGDLPSASGSGER